MSHNPTDTGQARHAWREIDRAEPPKRAAAERYREAAAARGYMRRGEDGARYRFRTCDPHRVKVMLYH